MRRVSVVGNSGSGKSTVARALAASLAVPYVELDAIFHQPGWTQLPREDFRARVAEVVAGEGWVVDGNYSTVRDLVWGRADTLVWVDPPRLRTTRQVVVRSVRRVVSREELWNGNRERWRELLSRDPQRSIVAWSWTRHRRYRDEFASVATDPAYANLTVVRLRSRRDVRELLGSVGRGITR